MPKIYNTISQSHGHNHIFWKNHVARLMSDIRYDVFVCSFLLIESVLFNPTILIDHTKTCLTLSIRSENGMSGGCVLPYKPKCKTLKLNGGYSTIYSSKYKIV